MVRVFPVMAAPVEVKPRLVQVNTCNACPFRSRDHRDRRECAAPAATKPPAAEVTYSWLNMRPPPATCPLRADAVLVVIG